MEKLKKLVPYVVLFQALGMSLVYGFSGGTVFALCVGAYLIKHFDQHYGQQVKDKKEILKEVENYKKSTMEIKQEVMDELTSLKSNIADMKLKGTTNGQEQKVQSGPFTGKRF